ncbi:TPA: hypothetical protein ACWWDF_002391 [Enterococcus faecium]
MNNLFDLSGDLTKELENLNSSVGNRDTESIDWCLSVDVCISEMGCDTTTVCEVGCHP